MVHLSPAPAVSDTADVMLGVSGLMVGFGMKLVKSADGVWVGTVKGLSVPTTSV